MATGSGRQLVDLPPAPRRAMHVADDVNDARLVKLVADGESEAFGSLFDRHASVVLGMLIQLLKRRELAEEILQETFLQAWKQADRYSAERATVRGWLLMLARSRARDFQRSSQASRRRELRAATDATLPTAAEPAGPRDLERRRRQQAVLRALAGLSEKQRRCVELAFFEGLSHSQIAERLDQPLGTVKSRILSGMRGLRQALSPNES